MIAALLFIFISSNALYYRAWEALEAAEPVHHLAKLSLANPPSMRFEGFGNSLTVQLPDGRVWFDRIGVSHSRQSPIDAIRYAINPFPASIGPGQYISGSNWISAVVRYYIYGLEGEQTNHFVYLETVGVKSDGTLWISDQSDSPLWTGDQMKQFGKETDWKTLSCSCYSPSISLLKTNGSLWRWGTTRWSDSEGPSPHRTTSLRDLSPYRLGTNSDWRRISLDGNHLQKKDGSLWVDGINHKNGDALIFRDTNWDNVDLDKIPPVGSQFRAYVLKDGTLWCSILGQSKSGKSAPEEFQVGNETNWVSAAGVWMGAIVALKSDGTLWQRGVDNKDDSLTRLGVHDDWVALSAGQDGAVTLAADGSLWLWPYRALFDQRQLLMKLPKQPKFLGNVFDATD